MDNPTLEAIRLNPTTLAVLHARARQARSVAMGNLAAALIRGIRAKLAPRPGAGNLFTRMG